MDQNQQQVTRTQNTPNPHVAIIGAGISGLMCARTLTDHGLQVRVFEKSRGVGGRMATRRAGRNIHFDHGAQYFTVRDERFKRHVDSWIQDGVAARWQGRVGTLCQGRLAWKDETTTRYVGVPGMNAICRHLATDLDIQPRTEVAPPKLSPDGWQLTDQQSNSLGTFDCVITSAPAPQSATLLAALPEAQNAAAQVTMIGCWAVMLAFDQSLSLPFEAAFVKDSLLSWIARNSSKPERIETPESWILHASAEWTRQHLEAAPDDVLPLMLDAFWQATGQEPTTPCHSAIHRWRYANVPEPLETRCLFDPQLGLGACGDWCNGPRVEGACLSGMAAAGQILTHFAR